MSVITWHGNSGNWSQAVDWWGFGVPGSLDTAVFAAGDTSTATLDSTIVVGGVSLAAGTLASLLVAGTLDLGGTLVLAGGTLALGPSGRIVGGTVDARGGAIVEQGGVADGVTWLGGVGGGVAITSATARATQTATGGVAMVGALTLEAGTYDGVAFAAALYNGAPATLSVADGAAVTLGLATTLVASADDPLHRAGVPPTYAGLTLAGAGTLVNAGTISSDLSGVLAPLTITAGRLVNTGSLGLAMARVPGVQQTFLVDQGGPPPGLVQVPVTLTFTESLPPELLLRGASFENDGLVTGAGATLVAQGAAFINAGTVALAAALGEFPFANGQTAYVNTLTIQSSIDITTAVTSFDNTGLLAASTIEFDGNVTLAQLGTLHGDLLFLGTVDLGGGTLDVGRLDPGHRVAFSGTVRDGTLVVDGGTLVTAGATLSEVRLLDVPPTTLLDVTAGVVVLGAQTTELAYTTAASIDAVTVVAGVGGTTDRIGARAAGTLTFGAGTLVSDTVAGSALAIGGPGVFRENGRVALDGASLAIATLDGTGTVTLADGAALAVGELAPSSAVTVAFGPGANLLSLPPSGASGVNLLGLVLKGVSSGDLIDFAGVSSQPIIGGTFGNGGASWQAGTLYVQGASGEQARVALTGSGGLTFTAGADGAGGTLVSVACFRHGTRIATPAGEVAVEHLRIGARVLTAGGRTRRVKWLGRRGYPARLVAAQPQLRPVRIAPGALAPGVPRRPLDVSPLHGVVLEADGGPVLVPAAALLGCPGISRAPAEDVAYVHVELATPDLLLAEGLATESFVDCDSRAQFDNAATFTTLYPRARPARWRFPLPRVEAGWRLHALRAGLRGEDAGVAAPGARARWAIDRDADGRIEGWVLDEASHAAPVALALCDGGRPVGWHLANRYRIDLDRAGVGGGRCAFEIEVPAEAWARRGLRTLAGAVLLAH